MEEGIVFETWNRDEISRNVDNEASGRIISQIRGNYKDNATNKTTFGVFMYQEISLATLEKEIFKDSGITIEWFRGDNISRRNQEIRHNQEILTDRDYCFLFFKNKFCGHFYRQKSWNSNKLNPGDKWTPGSQPLRLADFRQNKNNTLNDYKTQATDRGVFMIGYLESYNGMVWSTENDIFQFNQITVPEYFLNQNSTTPEQPGYRSSLLISLKYKETIIYFITIHGFVSLAGKKDKNTKFLDAVFTDGQQYDNMVIAGDFNMTSTDKKIYDGMKLFKEFVTADDINKPTNYSEHNGVKFEEKLDWIFYKFTHQIFKNAKITAYCGDLQLVKNKFSPNPTLIKNLSDHVRINIKLTINRNPPRENDVRRNADAVAAPAAAPAAAAAAAPVENPVNDRRLREKIINAYITGFNLAKEIQKLGIKLDDHQILEYAKKHYTQFFGGNLENDKLYKYVKKLKKLLQ